jgi:putative addiction module killer protein
MRSRALSPAYAAWKRETPGIVEASGRAFWKCVSHYGPGYRVYYVHRGARIVVLLCGGDKRTQQQDIKRAQMLAGTV